MSLINKMLQDLDARGTPKDGALPGQVKPVERTPSRPRGRAIALAVGGAVAVLALGWLGWQRLHHGARPAPAVVAPVVANAARVPPSVSGPVQASAPAPAMVSGPVPAPTAASAPAAAAPAEPPHVDTMAPPGAASAAAPAEADNPATKRLSRAERRAERARLARERREEEADAVKHAKAEKGGRTATVRAKDVAPMEPDGEEAREARRAMAQALAARGKSVKKSSAAMLAAARAAARDEGAGKGRPSVQGREETGSQRAEGEYRRALASLQEGRMVDTVAALERALKYQPTHEAARQTLVGCWHACRSNGAATASTRSRARCPTPATTPITARSWRGLWHASSATARRLSSTSRPCARYRRTACGGWAWASRCRPRSAAARRSTLSRRRVRAAGCRRNCKRSSSGASSSSDVEPVVRSP
jgi:MSHA biogenesis protein MshN